MTWTKKYIDQLLKEGKIRGYKENGQKCGKGTSSTGGRIVNKHFKKRSKEKDFIAWNILQWAIERKVELQEEYRFHPERKWRFDWCIPSLKIAVEYEGIFSEKSRHTSVKGFTGDTEKYNTAVGMGWKVLRFTALNYKQLITILNTSAQ